jgi:hypothetical protein
MLRRRYCGAPEDERAMKTYISGGNWSWQRDGCAGVSASPEVYPHLKAANFKVSCKNNEYKVSSIKAHRDRLVSVMECR